MNINIIFFLFEKIFNFSYLLQIGLMQIHISLIYLLKVLEMDINFLTFLILGLGTFFTLLNSSISSFYIHSNESA